MSQLEVFSPWDGSHIGSVPIATVDEVERSLATASAAHKSCTPTLHERASVLDRAVSIMLDRSEELASTICLEAGKPITAARLEVTRTCDTFRASAVEARSLVGTMIPMDASVAGDGRFGFTDRVPIGVVLAITPFNFPLNLSAHKLAPAIAAGCPVIHKPASATPLTAQILHSILLEAGQPADRLHLLCGPGATVGEQLVRDDRVELITFTGSSSVGWGIKKQAPRTHVTLELGNATPIIIRHDADVERAAQAIVAGGFGFAGQSCISVQRVIAHSSIRADLLACVIERVATLSVGNPQDPTTVVGPLINARAAEKARDIVGDSVQDGAQIVAGTSAISGPNSTLMSPTILANVTPNMRIGHEEIFGPCVAFMQTTDDTDDELVRLANSSPYGLQAGIWTSDISKALQMSRELEFGCVVINESPTFRADQMPYGGVKDSGNAKEGPHWTVRSMTTERLVILGALPIG